MPSLTSVRHLLLAPALALATALTIAVTATPAGSSPAAVAGSPASATAPTASTAGSTARRAAAGEDWVRRAQRRLNRLGCDSGPVDGRVGTWTRTAVVRFQSRHGMRQTGHLTKVTRQRLHADRARRCDRRPLPAESGRGRRIVLSQAQNWVWLVGRKGRAFAQGGMVDNPAELAPGSYSTGSYCGRAARIRKNTTVSGTVWLDNFVRFAPCGFGFHRIPTSRTTGAQIHADHLLGTDHARSHGCIRLTRAMSERVWRFTGRAGTVVRVV